MNSSLKLWYDGSKFLKKKFRMFNSIKITIDVTTTLLRVKFPRTNGIHKSSSFGRRLSPSLAHFAEHHRRRRHQRQDIKLQSLPPMAPLQTLSPNTSPCLHPPQTLNPNTFPPQVNGADLRATRFAPAAARASASSPLSTYVTRIFGYEYRYAIR